MAENEQILPPESMTKEKLATDVMFKLGHIEKDKEKPKKALPSLTMIQQYQSPHTDDFLLNSTLREKLRTEKKALSKRKDEDNTVRMRTNLAIPLLPANSEDNKKTALLTFVAPESFEEKKHSKRKEISLHPWLRATFETPRSARGILLHKLNVQQTNKCLLNQ